MGEQLAKYVIGEIYNSRKMKLRYGLIHMIDMSITFTQIQIKMMHHICSHVTHVIHWQIADIKGDLPMARWPSSGPSCIIYINTMWWCADNRH